MKKIKKISIASVKIAAGMLLIAACNSSNTSSNYIGKAYEDEVYKGGAQTISGKLQCEYYDFGGEGVAFHDTDSANSGSGALNPADGSYLHEFRMNEPVDISYTKFREPAIDNTPYNFVDPEKEQLYVGWTKPGEWMKYTINVETEGMYQLGLMFTSNKDGRIAFAVNDIMVTEPILIPSTFVAADTVAWRQWHHWNYIGDLAKIKLKKGIQTFTLHTVEIGDMNYDYINFELLK
ncbi:MAG: hypothetical protein PF517_04135 [Salinivirgaceae bacterium]|jgi:hypothetical protein|nr:hypothetical protein [Salinivirgaceae bacterium]